MTLTRYRETYSQAQLYAGEYITWTTQQLSKYRICIKTTSASANIVEMLCDYCSMDKPQIIVLRRRIYQNSRRNSWKYSMCKIVISYLKCFKVNTLKCVGSAVTTVVARYIIVVVTLLRSRSLVFAAGSVQA